jgi:hypothetical protein
MEVALNTSTIAQQIIGGDKKGTQCLRRVKLAHLVPRGYKYGNLALQIRGVSNLRQ